MAQHQFRGRPVVITAMQLPKLGVSASEELIAYLHSGNVLSDYGGGVVISTLEGDMRGDPEDWIIKGLRGEFYPCKPDVFGLKYEPVVEEVDVVVIHTAEFISLTKRIEKLNALEAAGVDNWEGYGDALRGLGDDAADDE